MGINIVDDRWSCRLTCPPGDCRDLASNNLTGALTDGWAAPTALPELRLLSLAGNGLAGSLPLVGVFKQALCTPVPTHTWVHQMHQCPEIEWRGAK